jgi:hypothetical protein
LAQVQDVLTLTINSDELRARFVKAEATLFKIRYDTDEAAERTRFVENLDLDLKLVRQEKLNFFPEMRLIKTSPFLPGIRQRDAREFCTRISLLDRRAATLGFTSEQGQI